MSAAPLFPGFDGLMTLSRREGRGYSPDPAARADRSLRPGERPFGGRRAAVHRAHLPPDEEGRRCDARGGAGAAAIYPATPAENPPQARLRISHPDTSACRPHRRFLRSPAAPAVRAPTEAELRMASNLSMRPNDAAEISDMFFAASASERALILHNLQETPLKAARVSRPPAHARDPHPGNGCLCRGRREFCARARRGANPAVAHCRTSG